MVEDDEFLTSVTAVWPEHSLESCGRVVAPRTSGKDYEAPIYTCAGCGAVYWPDIDSDQFYTDRFVPHFDGTANANIAHCECWEKIPRVIPRVEEPIKGLQRIRDDLEGL